MNWIKRNVNFMAAMDGAEVEFDEDAVKALLPAELTLVSYSLGLARKSPDKMLVFFDARNASGGQHIYCAVITKEHFRVGQGYDISEVWKQRLAAGEITVEEKA